MDVSRRFLLLLAASVALLAACVQTAPAYDGLKVDKLEQLIETIKAGEFASVDDIVEAYKQYVELYKAQARLVNSGAPNQATDEGELKYEHISKLLESPQLQDIVERIFCEIPDDSSMTGEIKLSESQRNNVKQAMDSFY